MILSIDPGINFCGLSVLDISSNFTVVDSVLVKNTRRFTDEEKLVEAEYGNRVVKIQAIVRTVLELLAKYNFDTIVIEAPFYNALTPVAFGSLLEVIGAIRYLIVIPNHLRFKLIEPLLAKKLFTSRSLASKELIKQFLISKKEDGSITISIDIEALSEHEIDSIAIGFSYNLMLKDQASHI